MSIIDERLKALKARLELLDYIDWEGTGDYNVDGDDKAFVTEVKLALAQRDLSLDELADMRKPHKDRENAAFRARMDRYTQQTTAGSHNKLFSVANKSQMKINVIAMDVDTAVEFAIRAGHVRSAENASAFRYNEKYIQTLTTSGSALGRAVREGVPGVVEKRGNNVIVRDRVFTPMSVVE